MTRRAVHSVPPVTNEQPVYKTCRACKRTDRVVKDGVFATHDISPYMRMVCPGSGYDPADVGPGIDSTRW